eukprot:gene4513-8554_t
MKKSDVGRRIFKKNSRAGKLTAYLGKRDFYEQDGVVDLIDGMIKVHSPPESGCYTFATIRVKLDYGVDAANVLGASLSKIIYQDTQRVIPPSASDPPYLTPLQQNLLRKLKDETYPFTFQLPGGCSSSVSIENTSQDVKAKSCAVEWELIIFTAASSDAKEVTWVDSVHFDIRKLSHAQQLASQQHKPHQEITKTFSLGGGSIALVAELGREVYYHGQPISGNISIINSSKRTIKGIDIRVRQFASIRTPKGGEILSHKCVVAEFASNEGFPISPSSNFQKVFQIAPSLSTIGENQNVALDGYGNDHADTCLASSTQLISGASEPQVGIIVSYDVKIKLHCTGMNGIVSCKLPFMLSTPAPDLRKLSVSLPQPQLKESPHKQVESELQVDDDSISTGDGLELVFEEFLVHSYPQLPPALKQMMTFNNDARVSSSLWLSESLPLQTEMLPVPTCFTIAVSSPDV